MPAWSKAMQQVQTPDQVLISEASGGLTTSTLIRPHQLNVDSDDLPPIR